MEGEGGGGGVLGGLAGDEGDGFGEPAFVGLGRDKLGFGEADAEVAFQLGIVLAKGDGADAEVGGGDEHASEGAGGGGEADEEAGTALAHLPWLHAEGFAGLLVEAAGGAEAGVVEGFGDGGWFGTAWPGRAAGRGSSA